MTELAKKRPKRNDDIPTCAELLKKYGGRCPVCGYVYLKSETRYRYYDPNNGTMHRAYHRRHVPKADPRLAVFPPGDIRVDIRSESWLHKLVYERARYLQRQEGYDFVQWQESEGFSDNQYEKDAHALLLIEAPQLIVGAAAFSWIIWQNHEPSWRLNFIWIAGSWRRKGVLSRRWPEWQKTYGAFAVEPPWSDDMLAFLSKRGVPDPVQAEWFKKIQQNEFTPQSLDP